MEISESAPMGCDFDEEKVGEASWKPGELVRRAREGVAGTAPTPGADATDKSESRTTGSTSSPKFVAFGGAT